MCVTANRDGCALPKSAHPAAKAFAADYVHWIHLRTTNPIKSTFATVRAGATFENGVVAERPDTSASDRVA